MQKQNYEVEVLVNGKPLKEYLHDGRHYVEGRKGTTFSIRLRNNTGNRKLFVPSIDGLSVMDGKECSFSSSGYIVRPYSAITIDGWRISDKDVAQFFFSSPDESYRKRMQKGNNLGVVGVAVFGEVEKPLPPIVIKEYVHSHCHTRYCSRCYRHHCDCSACPIIVWGGSGSFTLSNTTASMNTATTTINMSAANTTADVVHDSMPVSLSNYRQDLGTGWGDTKRSEVTTVEFDRQSDPAATFEIYYNTREQLESMGVNFNRESVQVSPQAFPGQYCPPPQD